jgi:hypothetical protein
MSTPFPDPITKPFSNTGDNADPPLGPISTAANQETGFPILESTPLNAGGIPVTREEFNGAFNFYTKQILALVSGARYTFDAAVSTEQNGYPLGAVLYDFPTQTYQISLKNNNTANFVSNPSYLSDGVNWSGIFSAFKIDILRNGYLNFNSITGRFLRFYPSDDMPFNTTYILPSIYPSDLDYVQILASNSSGIMQWVSFDYFTNTGFSVTSGPGVWTQIATLNLPGGRYLLNATVSSTGVSGTPPTAITFAITSIAPPGVPTDASLTNGLLSANVVSTTLGHTANGCIANYFVEITSFTQDFYLSAKNEDGTDAGITGTLSATCIAKLS